jgi:hypothetical protein
MAADWEMSESEFRRLHLLEWLIAQPEAVSNVGPFYSNDGEMSEQARIDVQALADRGYVQAVLTMDGLAGVAAMVTAGGHVAEDEVRRLRADRQSRIWACRMALLLWLFDQDASVDSGKTVTLEGFFLTERSLFWGDQFTLDDLDRANAYLLRHGFIDGVRAAQAVGVIRAMLTDDGLQCIERFGGDVRACVTAKEQALRSSISMNVSGHNVQVAAGDSNQQTMTVTQTADDVVNAISGIAEILRIAGGVGDEDELNALVEQAISDMKQSTPSPSGFRKFARWVRDRLNGGLDATIGAAITASLVGVESAISHIIGSS